MKERKKSGKNTKIISAALLISIGGFFGITFLFSDFGQGETAGDRMFSMGVYFFILGLIVGVLTFPRWWMSVFTAWGGMIFFFIFLIGLVFSGIPKDLMGFFFGLGQGLLPLGAALTAGYLSKSIMVRRGRGRHS